MNRHFQKETSDIFSSQTAFAKKHNSVNLGQGFPEEDGPRVLREIAANAFMQPGNSQYTAPQGHPELIQAIQDIHKSAYGQAVGADNILVTAGATEALNISLRVLLEPGDEIIVFEPYYNFYNQLIETTGAVIKPVRLSPPRWSFEEADLARAVSDKTKAILLNSPSNPTGKIFTRDELSEIANLCHSHDLYAISDDVYEFLVDSKIPRLSELPGMEARTIHISSAGKSFSFTGWRLGYLTAPDRLMPALTKAHIVTSFSSPVPLQVATAAGLRDKDYIDQLGTSFKKKATLLSKGLSNAGLEPLANEGGYFVVADYSAWGFQGSDSDFSYYLTEKAGVTPLPLSAFYQEPRQAPQNLLRFCIAKKDETLLEASKRLEGFAKLHNKPSLNTKRGLKR